MKKNTKNGGEFFTAFGQEVSLLDQDGPMAVLVTEPGHPAPK